MIAATRLRLLLKQGFQALQHGPASARQISARAGWWANLYRVDGPLGGGNDGTVMLGRDKADAEQVALKFSRNPKALREEFKLHCRAAGPGVVKPLHLSVDTVHAYACLVTEYVAGGPLSGVDGTLPEAALKKVFKGAFAGLESCVANGVCHRDLYARNILIDADGNGHIADFGRGFAGRSEMLTEFDLRTLLDACGGARLGRHPEAYSADCVAFFALVDDVKPVTLERVKQHPWFKG